MSVFFPNYIFINSLKTSATKIAMRRLYSQSNIDIANKLSTKPALSGQYSLNSSFTQSQQQGKSQEKSTFRKFESLEKNISLFDKKPSSEQNIPEGKQKMLDTLQFLTLPSIKANESEIKYFSKDKKIKQAICEQSKSECIPSLNGIQTKTVIFYHHTQPKEVSLDKLKDKSSSYKRLQFKKKNQYSTCKPEQIQKIIHTICKNATKESKSAQLVDGRAQNIDQFSKSNELIKEILSSASEVKIRPARKISFRQSSLKEQQLQDNEDLKRITENSFQHQNASKVLPSGGSCMLCGTNNSLTGNKSSKLHEKYESLQKLVLQLKKQYKKLGEEFLLFKQSLQLTISNLIQTEKIQKEIKQKQFYPSKIQKIGSNQENIKQNELISQFSDCYEFMHKLEEDLLNQDVSISSISKNLKMKPVGMEEQQSARKILKKEMLRLNNDISFSSIRSVGKIVKNIKREKKKNQQNFKSLLDDQMKILDQKIDINFKENIVASKINMNSSAKSPQSPPTKQPVANSRLTRRSMKLQTFEQKEKNRLEDPPLTSRKQEKLNISTYSVSNSRCTRKQSKSCYQNIQSALSRIKQSLI